MICRPKHAALLDLLRRKFKQAYASLHLPLLHRNHLPSAISALTPNAPALRQAMLSPRRGRTPHVKRCERAKRRTWSSLARLWLARTLRAFAASRRTPITAKASARPHNNVGSFPVRTRNKGRQGKSAAPSTEASSRGPMVATTRMGCVTRVQRHPGGGKPARRTRRTTAGNSAHRAALLSRGYWHTTALHPCAKTRLDLWLPSLPPRSHWRRQYHGECPHAALVASRRPEEENTPASSP